MQKKRNIVGGRLMCHTMVFDCTFTISKFWRISLLMTRTYRKIPNFSKVALDGFGLLTLNTFTINHKKAYLFNFRVREIFHRLINIIRHFKVVPASTVLCSFQHQVGYSSPEKVTRIDPIYPNTVHSLREFKFAQGRFFSQNDYRTRQCPPNK